MIEYIKKYLKKIVAWKLEWLAKAALKKYKPKIVAVTGSVGKTSTKDMIALALEAKYKVRASAKSFNSEIGVPLTILNLPNAWLNPIGWIKNFLWATWLIVWPDKFRKEHNKYPEYLVLEVGADRPGDIQRVAEWLLADVVVLTRVPDVPVHMEFFRSAGDVIKEKLSLIKGLKDDGVLVVNSDDKNLAGALPVKQDQIKVTYGFERGTQILGSHPHVVYREADGLKKPDGIACNIEYDGREVSLRLPGVVATHQLYAALAAFTVALSQGVEANKIIEALTHTVAPPGRMRLIDGIKKTFILDDSYNASPVAMSAALEMLGRLEVSGRRIAVLGDMMELGEQTIEAHRAIGAEANVVTDVIVAVGLRSKFILEVAGEAGKPVESLKWFNDAHEAGMWLQNNIAEGDMILVKGSQSGRMERVVEEIMLRPELKEELLCRQEQAWKKR